MTATVGSEQSLPTRLNKDIMTKIVSIAGLPCCGKTTLCNSFAALHNGLSLDVEYLRTLFFEEDLNNNVFKFSHNEPIKKGEDLRTYFLRCAIYERIITLDEYIEWYTVIMKYMNKKILELVNDFENINYEDFKHQYRTIIRWSPSKKPDLIVLNHALLPLTDIWNNSTLSVLLTGKESVLAARFVKREGLGIDGKKYSSDISRHMHLYSTLNNGAKATVVYDTTDHFMDVQQIESIYKKMNYHNEPRS